MIYDPYKILVEFRLNDSVSEYDQSWARKVIPVTSEEYFDKVVRPLRIVVERRYSVIISVEELEAMMTTWLASGKELTNVSGSGYLELLTNYSDTSMAYYEKRK